MRIFKEKPRDFYASVLLMLVAQMAALDIGIQGVLFALGHESFSNVNLAAGVFGMAFCTYLKVAESVRMYKK